MRIQPAELGDAPAIAGVVVESWRAAYRGLVADEFLDELSVDDRTGRWASRIAAPHASVLVADDDGSVVGACSSAAPSPDRDARPGCAELGALYVHPDHWRRGVGRALLSAALAGLDAAGWREVTLWVLAGNEAAISFYRRFGFRADGAEGVHPRSGAATARFCRSLTGPSSADRDRKGDP